MAAAGREGEGECKRERVGGENGRDKHRALEVIVHRAHKKLFWPPRPHSPATPTTCTMDHFVANG